MFNKILSIALLVAVLSVMVVTPTFASPEDDIRAKVEDTIMVEEEIKRPIPDPGPKKVEVMSKFERLNLEIADVDTAPARYPAPLYPIDHYTCYLDGFQVPCYFFSWLWD